MKTSFALRLMLVVASLFSATTGFSQTIDALDSNYVEIPELVFEQPRLISGSAGKQGAIYRYNNIAPGFDATIRLKTFSRPTIYVEDIDLPTLGFDRAFQPKFGLTGNVASNQNWYIDFELTFLAAGTNNKKTIDKFMCTALDVDGDGATIREYVNMEKATSVSYSPITFLKPPTTSAPVAPSCSKCNKASFSKNCGGCAGIGRIGTRRCGTCKGVGKLFNDCGHPWEGQNINVQAPVDNFEAIDTSATSVMATYVYNNKDVINFRIGAFTGNRTSRAGIRLNSIWFKAFNLAAQPNLSIPLPLHLQSFEAELRQKDVVLNWTVGDESNDCRYRVERSADGEHFETIAILFSDTKIANGRYAFTDKKVGGQSAYVFYRITLQERNRMIYSQIQVIRLWQAEAIFMGAFPNPAKDLVTVTLPANWAGKAVTLSVYNAQGVLLQSRELKDAAYTERISLGQLPVGIYFINANTRNASAREMILKQ